MKTYVISYMDKNGNITRQKEVKDDSMRKAWFNNVSPRKPELSYSYNQLKDSKKGHSYLIDKVDGRYITVRLK